MYQISRLNEEICNNELVSINNKLYSVAFRTDKLYIECYDSINCLFSRIYPGFSFQNATVEMFTVKVLK